MIQNGDIKARITMARQVQIWKLSVSSIRVLKNSSAYPEMDFSDYGKWISNQFNIEKKINNSKDLLTIWISKFWSELIKNYKKHQQIELNWDVQLKKNLKI